MYINCKSSCIIRSTVKLYFSDSCDLFLKKYILYFKEFKIFLRLWFLNWFFLGFLLSSIFWLKFFSLIMKCNFCISIDDQSRVVLVNTNTDYINANYIDVSSYLKTIFVRFWKKNPLPYFHQCVYFLGFKSREAVYCSTRSVKITYIHWFLK